MRTKRIMGHQLLGDLFRKSGIEAATNINRHQFSMLALVVCFKFSALLIKCGLFSIRLGMDRDEFSGGHRHSACDQTGNPRNQYAAVRCMRGRDTEYEA